MCGQDRRRIAVLSTISGLLLTAALSSACVGSDPGGTRPWNYGSGEEVRLGSGWVLALQPGWSARIDIPWAHAPGERDPAYLPVELYGPGGGDYEVGVDSEGYARDCVETTLRLVRNGEYPNTSVQSTALRDLRVDLAITDDSQDVMIQAYLWPTEGDPIWIQVSGDQALSDGVRRCTSPSAIAEIVMDRIGLRRE